MMRWNHVIFLFWAWGSFGNVIYLEVISYLADGFSISSTCISRRLPHVFRASSATSPRRERWEFSNNAERSIDSSVECDSKDTPVVSYEIRDSTHKELSFVADLIVDSFYNYSSANTVWKQFTKLAELNRIQQNFPYGDDRAVHRMMVLSATSGNVTSLCGFVDVDARKPNRHTSYKYNPRPYLSDLCIHPDYRRYGYATLLIQACEAFCRSELPPMAFSPAGNLRSDICAVPELYIRVETSNIAAGQMYRKLGYSIVHNHSDAGNDKIVILHKRL
jgi:ribosomal protein S18 acetylase RimI-like enzyme